MEAEDTIAQNDKIGVYDNKLTPQEKELVEWVKEAQSEVSFKAGIREGILLADKTGGHGHFRTTPKGECYFDSNCCACLLLKEWGIK